jgi:hypothetical protein
MSRARELVGDGARRGGRSSDASREEVRNEAQLTKRCLRGSYYGVVGGKQVSDRQEQQCNDNQERKLYGASVRTRKAENSWRKPRRRQRSASNSQRLEGLGRIEHAMV